MLTIRLSTTLVLLLTLSLGGATIAASATPFSECTEDRPHVLSDAVYRICTPPDFWIQNRQLVIWAHGYVDEFQPIEIPEDQVCFTEDLCINDIINFLGYDFATTSYAVNGLAVLPGIQDVLELIDLTEDEIGMEPIKVFVTGASEGGLITALTVEDHFDQVDGGLATCGPIGDFKRQIRYFGDFRVIFDYFYPGVLPGTPTEIPQQLIDNWDTYYNDTIFPLVTAPENMHLTRQLFDVTRAPYDPNDVAATAEVSLSDLLWYNVFATNNANDVLGGNPYDNNGKVYNGSDDDDALNAGVQRISADPVAFAEMDNYQTTGVLVSPLVTLHTLLDQQVPAEHELWYLDKTRESGAQEAGLHVNHPMTLGYGHCLFSLQDVISAFNLMIEISTGEAIPAERIDALREFVGEELWTDQRSWGGGR